MAGRWLEDPDSEETKEFVNHQNAVTEEVMEQCSSQEDYKAVVQQLFDYPRISAPSRHGDRCGRVLRTSCRTLHWDKWNATQLCGTVHGRTTSLESILQLFSPESMFPR